MTEQEILEQLKYGEHIHLTNCEDSLRTKPLGR